MKAKSAKGTSAKGTGPWHRQDAMGPVPLADFCTSAKLAFRNICGLRNCAQTKPSPQKQSTSDDRGLYIVL